MLTPRIRKALVDPAVRFPVKEALRAALDRDCLDAWEDAQLVADLLRERLDLILDTEEETIRGLACPRCGQVEDHDHGCFDEARP